MAYTETKYVNVTTGSDTTGDGSMASPYATIEYCIGKLTTTNPLVILDEGIYPVTYLCYMSASGKTITFEGANKKTVIEVIASNLSSWKGAAIIKSCIIRPSNSFSVDTRAISYTSDTMSVQFYNICFTTSTNGVYPTATYFFNDGSGTTYKGKDYINCTFTSSKFMPVAAGGSKLINCAIGYSSTVGTITDCKFNLLFNSDFYIVNVIGDKSEDNLIYGVYSGEFLWSNKVLLKYNNKYYSIQKDLYDIETKQYIPLESADIDKYGFDPSELFQEIKIGNETTDITPVMTSNTTPSPYTITSSTKYNDTYDAWKAFNGTNSDGYDCWVTASGVKTGWIMVDFNAPTTIGGFSLTCRYGTNVAAPSGFVLEGSNDGLSFDVLKTVTGDSVWEIAETKYYGLDDSATYQYYRLTVNSINSGDYVAIAEIKFIYVSPLLESFKPIDKFNNFTLATNDSKVKLLIKGIKKDKQLVVASDDIPYSIALNIDYFKLDYNLSDNAKLKIALSIDKGQTWKTWNTSTSTFDDLVDLTIPLKEYSTLTEEELLQWNTAMETILENGIAPDIFNTLDFNLLNADAIRFAYAFYRPTYIDTANTSKLEWQFDAKGSMRKMTDSEYTVDVYEKEIKVTSLIKNEIVKVNVMM